VTCPRCGQEERQDRKVVVEHVRPLTLHHECAGGHAWHMPMVIRPATRPGPCECEAPP
jgi:hypothetical protein